MKKIIVLTLIVLFYGCAKNPSLTTQKLLEAQRLNVLEQPIVYPTQQPAEVTSVIRVLQPRRRNGLAQTYGATPYLSYGGYIRNRV